MLISTGMPGIQRRLWHPVRANQSQSPCQSRTCQSHLSQLGLLDHVRVHLSEPCLSEPGLSETLSETLSELHLSEPHVSEPELSETMSERTLIAGMIRDYVRATLIRPRLSETISEPQLPQPSSDEYQVVVAVPISRERYRLSQECHIQLIQRSNQAIFGMCTLPLVDEHRSSVC